MVVKLLSVVAVLISSALVSGCAAIGLTLFGVGAGVSTGTAVSYSWIRCQSGCDRSPEWDTHNLNFHRAG